MIKKEKIALVSLGCDKNLVDSEVMIGVLRNGGYETTVFAEQAEVIILNTCGFLESAIEEGFDTASELLKHKKHGNCKKFIMTGCMATRYKDEVFETLPSVDAIVGAADYDKILEVVDTLLEKGKKITCMTDINRNVSEEAKKSRVIATPKHYAYLKISEGCDNRCTYCAIPSIRGKYRSRKLEHLIEEAESLAKLGVKELVLVAQDTSLYGMDLYNEKKLAELLQKLSEISGIEWLRVLYCYPEHITPELIAEIKNNKKVLHYIDMPIQHAADTVLKRMNRKSNKEGIKIVIKQLRDEIPDITIRTTLIAGFPGETKKEFDELLDFVKEIRFDRLGCFAYSKEEGTPAANMDGHIGKKEREKRAEKIMEVQAEIAVNLNKEKVGKTYRVILEEELEDGVFVTRSCSDAPAVDPVIYAIPKDGESLEIGQFAEVLVTETASYDLIGEII